MEGFDPRWTDQTNYILGVTHEIWEDRGISTLTQYYGDDIIVRSPASIVVGNENVIGATMATLAELPDRQLLGEDVIFCDAPSGGFLSSHRLMMMPPRAAVRWSINGLHSGWGAFGKPTGAQVHVMGITHAEFGPRGLRCEFTLIDETAVWKQILIQTGEV